MCVDGIQLSYNAATDTYKYSSEYGALYTCLEGTVFSAIFAACGVSMPVTDLMLVSFGT